MGPPQLRPQGTSPSRAFPFGAMAKARKATPASDMDLSPIVFESGGWPSRVRKCRAVPNDTGEAMPALKNAKHEAFAQALAAGKSASEAYTSVGYKDSRSAASRLSAKVNIGQRVAEIVARVSEKAEWDAAARLKMLAEIAENTAKDDPRVAVSAIAEANKMQGSHAPTRQELTGKDGRDLPTQSPVTIFQLPDNGRG